jgi:hypothetical protein
MNLLLGLWYGDGKDDDDDDDDDGVLLLTAIISTCASLSDTHIPPPTKNIDEKKENEKLTSSVRATQTINERIRSRNFSLIRKTHKQQENSARRRRRRRKSTRETSRGREKRREEEREREEIKERKRGRHLFCLKKIHRKMA